jgi:hypothetical protein
MEEQGLNIMQKLLRWCIFRYLLLAGMDSYLGQCNFYISSMPVMDWWKRLERLFQKVAERGENSIVKAELNYGHL